MTSEIDRGRVGSISRVFGSTVMSKVAQLLLPFGLYFVHSFQKFTQPRLDR
jgi:hypothetical protein